MSDPFVPIFQSVAAGPCFEQALVLEARGFDYELRSEGSILQLAVPPPTRHARARSSSNYRIENVPLARRAADCRSRAAAAPEAIAFVVALLAITWFDDRALFGHDWFRGRQGRRRAQSAPVEWWRPLTALTLHADAAHLFGNLVFGVLFGYAAGQLLGSGVAWFQHSHRGPLRQRREHVHPGARAHLGRRSRPRCSRRSAS
jgi:hypothetical protein